MTVTVGRSYDANLNYVGTGAGQWTVITPSGTWKDGYGGSYPASGTSMLVYVSHSTGHTIAGGGTGSHTNPLLTLAEAYSLLRDGQPDWILLKKGDTWTDEIIFPLTHGLNSNEPQVITSYSSTGVDATHPRGTGTGNRPILAVTTTPGASPCVIGSDAPGRTLSQGPVAIIGIEVNGGGPSIAGTGIDGGIRLIGKPGTFVLIEDCYIHDCAHDGIYIYGYDYTTVGNPPFNMFIDTVILRRNIVHLCGPVGSGGIFAAFRNFTFEENAFIANGNQSGSDNRSHNFYIAGYKPDGTPITGGGDGCGISNAGQLCIVNHAGGNITITESLQSGSHYRSGGTITDHLGINAFWTFDFTYKTQRTLVVNSVTLQGYGYRANPGFSGVAWWTVVDPNYNNDNYVSSLGCFIHNNICTNPGTDANPTADCPDRPIFLNPGWDYIDVANNVLNGYGENGVFDQTGGTHVNIGTNYSRQIDSSTWDGGLVPPIDGRSRTMLTYMTATFGSGGTPQFIAGCLAQSADNWVYGYTANSVNNYFRAGFGMAYYTLAGISITPGSVPAGTVGVPYNGGVALSFTASGGTAPYTWTHSGTVPPGLNFNDAAATLSGTPTTAGNYSFSITANDSAAGTTGPISYSIKVFGTPITISPATLPSPATVGVLYPSTPLTASGGLGPFTFAVTGGLQPPPGISLVGNTIQGTPTAQGSYTFTVTATDSLGATGPQTYTIQVNASTAGPPTIRFVHHKV